MVRLVQSSVESVRPAAEAKGLVLSVALVPQAFVYGDSVQLTQVMTNLLSNALKFTQSGGTIDVAVAVDQDAVRVAVSDSGRGIAAQDLPHVFERFQQVDSSTTRTAGGLGLGLAIVDHVVRAHGGDVTAWSPGLGGGASFAVRLRRAESAEDSTAALPEAVDEAALEGQKILCVDDDVDALDVLSKALREHGALVTTARSAADAIAAITEWTPDLVVSDIGLPVQDGYELMREIRKLPGRNARVPAIALTAYAGPASEDRAREAGYQIYLCKPVEPKALLHAVATLTGARPES